MDAHLVQRIRETMQAKSTEELLQKWVENDREQYSDETFDTIKQLLSERGAALPPQRSSEEKGILETQVRKKTKLWKKVLCTVLVLSGLFYFALAFNNSELRMYILGGNPIATILYCLVGLIAAFLGPLFVAFMMIWGASFLWGKWRIILGVGLLGWGIIYLREGLRSYILNTTHVFFIEPLALVEPKGNIGIGLFIMLVGCVILGVDLYRRFVKKGTPTICCGGGGGEGVNRA